MIQYTYICNQCGSRYLSVAKVDAFAKCRNENCTGQPRRKK